MLRSLTVALLLCSLWLPVLAEAKSKAPPVPERNTKRTTSAFTPKPLHPSEIQTSPWTDGEIAAAKAECTATLSGVRLDFEPLSPIRQGLCGTPAPILLVHVLGLLLLVGRIVHAWGVSCTNEKYTLRVIGITLTLVSIGLAALYLLWVALVRLLIHV